MNLRFASPCSSYEDLCFAASRTASVNLSLVHLILDLWYSPSALPPRLAPALLSLCSVECVEDVSVCQGLQGNAQ